MSNKEFAQRHAKLADALSEYDHLPSIGLTTITDRSVYLCPAGSGHEGIVALARWAAAFDVPVTLSVSPNWEVTTRLQLGGRVDVLMYVSLARQQVHELGVRLGQALTAAGDVGVPAVQLLAVLHVDQAETVPAVANA